MSAEVVVLPFVPVTPIVGAGQRRRKRSTSDTRAGAAGSPARRAVDERAERGAKARLGRRVVRVDRRRGRHERGAGQATAGRPPGPASSRTGGPSGRRRLVASSAAGRGRRRPSRRAPAAEEADQGDPAAGQAEHGDRPPAQGAALDVGEGQPVEVDRASVVAIIAIVVSGIAHGSALIDARKNVTPSRPARIETIQKRRVIFSSSQPPSSKWWWIGVIRKIRLPPVALK